MSTTRDEIIRLAEEFVLAQGFNWLSYADISQKLGIKNAAIHYHFPTKEDLGLAIIERDRMMIAELMTLWEHQHTDAIDMISELFGVYSAILQGRQVCLIGSLGTDMLTLPDAMQGELKKLVNLVLAWLKKQLERGRANGTAVFEGSSTTQAMALLTNMVAGIQIARLHNSTREFNTLTAHALNNLRPLRMASLESILDSKPPRTRKKTPTSKD
jgi:TetR/AcrR family transcriptional regulator, transcriptional repressor for nem operon